MKRHVWLGILLVGIGLARAEDLLKAPVTTVPNAPVVNGLPDAAGQVAGEGRVLALDRHRGTLTVAQEALPALGWPALQVRFEIDPALLEGVSPGDAIDYAFRSVRGAARIERLEKR